MSSNPVTPPLYDVPAMKTAAGIVFYCHTAEGTKMLLVKRAINPGKGMWGGSGGKMDGADYGNPWKTAVRETLEEFGDCPEFRNSRFNLENGETPSKSVLRLLSFQFFTYFVKLEGIPNIEFWPSKDRSVAKDCREWSEKKWFAFISKPFQLSPSVWRIGKYLR